MDEDRPLWREGLQADMRDLGPDVDGRVLHSTPPGAEAVPSARFLDPEYLRSAIVYCGESLCPNVEGDPDVDVKLVAAASRFTRHYLSSLTAAALVALARGVGLDLTPKRCVKVTDHGTPRRHLFPADDAGIVTCAERPAAWRVDGESVETVDQLRRYVWGRLYGEHLAPLFHLAGELTHVTARVLWSNAAEWVAHAADVAVVYVGPVDAAPLVEEATWLLDAPSLPGVAGPNPLSGLIDYTPVGEPDFPRGLQTRRHCCMTYVLPSRVGYLCGNCPFLPIEQRIALVRERRHPGSAKGSVAQLQSIETGRSRISVRS